MSNANPLLVTIAGQHGDEPLGLVVAQAINLGARPIVGSSRWIHSAACLNPEGLGRGRRVRNDNIDPNRVWGTAAQSDAQASILALLADARSEGRRLLVLDCHSDHKPAHTLVAGTTGASVARGARMQRVEGSLAAWCEDHGIPCVVLEAEEGGDVAPTIAAGLDAVRAAYAA